jgi:clan AA aspartic protease
VIQGSVSPDLEALFELELASSNRRAPAAAAVDTGFDGALTITSELVQQLALQPQGSRLAILADGSERFLTTYRVGVRWVDGEIEVLALETQARPLIGMSLLKGYELRIQVIDGGEATVGRL